MVVINSFKEYEAFLGKQIGISDWHEIAQEQISNFAEASLDFQWIHTDQERANRESPFGSTIAHGFLTLSLIPHLWKQIADIQNVKMEVNYGIEKFKFNLPVLVNDKVQLRAKLITIANLRGITKVTIEANLDVQGKTKPAYTGNVVFLYHFK